jgi:hypothetical protein
MRRVYWVIKQEVSTLDSYLLSGLPRRWGDLDRAARFADRDAALLACDTLAPGACVVEVTEARASELPVP